MYYFSGTLSLELNLSRALSFSLSLSQCCNALPHNSLPPDCPHVRPLVRPATAPNFNHEAKRADNTLRSGLEPTTLPARPTRPRGGSRRGGGVPKNPTDIEKKRHVRRKGREGEAGQQREKGKKCFLLLITVKVTSSCKAPPDEIQ